MGLKAIFNVFQGFLNGKNVTYLNENYVSLSRPQDILLNLTITGNVMFKNIVEAGRLEMPTKGMCRHSSG